MSEENSESIVLETVSTEETTNGKKAKSRRKVGRSMFGPILLIAIGVFLLLSNLDLLPELNWQAVLRLWPLLLVFAGLNVIVRQAGRPAGTVLSALLAFLAVAVFGYVLLYADQTPFVGDRLSGAEGTVEEQHVTFPVAGVQEAELFVDFSAPGGNVFALQDSSQLIDAKVNTSGELLFEHELTAGQAVISLESSARSKQTFFGDPFGWFEDVEADPWQVGLSPRVPINLEMNLGSGSVDMALESLDLSGLIVDGGSGSAELRLPAGDYDMAYDVGSGSIVMTLPSSGAHTFTIDGGSGSLTIFVPESAAVRLTTEGGSGGLNIPDGIFEASSQRDGNEGRWQSTSYAVSDEQIELFIDIGSGSVTFERE